MAKAELEAFMRANEITISSTFVPWSKSRNKDEKDDRGNPRRSLNWRVTIARKGREILTTDYSAGIAHCPCYNQKDAARMTIGFTALLDHEVENGFAARKLSWRVMKGAPITPDPCDVLSSLALDAGVIDYATFEDWAAEYGYDPDSRKGEAIYRACLEIALKLRAGLGDVSLSGLRDAAQDY